GEEHDMVEPRRKLHGIDGKLDVHVALDLPASLAVGVLLRRLRDHAEAVVVKPVDKRSDRRVVVVLQQRGVVERTQQLAPALEFLPEKLVVYVESQRLCRGVEVRPVDEQREPFVLVEHQLFLPEMNRRNSFLCLGGQTEKSTGVRVW